MRLLDKNKINLVKVEDNYFPFFHIKNAFQEDIDCHELVESFPQIDTGGSFPSENLIDGPLKDLIQELEGGDFKNILEEKLDVDLKDAVVVTTLRGYSRLKDGQIHTDSNSKILTVLLYLNLDWDETIGNLRLLKNNSNLDDYIQEVPSSFGSLLAFKVTENCWHGFHAFEGKRLSVQMNYIYKRSFSSHKLRHLISSKLKKIFTSKKH